MRTDTIFYQLFQTFPRLLWELLDQDPDLASSYEFSSREVKELAFRLDGVFLPQEAHQPIYFLEVQYQRVETFYWRFITEIFVYLNQYQPEHDWLGVVLFSSRTVDPGLPRVYRSLEQQLRILYLDELAFGNDSPLEQQILALIIRPEGEARQQVERLQAGIRGLDDVSQQQVILELVEKIAAYKFKNLSREEIEAMFTMEDLKQTRYVQELMAEKLQEGERAIILKQLTRRLGSLSPAIETQVQNLSVTELEALAEALLDFTDLDDLSQWLSQH
ncbi:MAG: Rpn family recombination-promoting nuclease/putative transposase [Synechococcales cyanobacterium]